ncbi:hypothetical protein [Nonomuraea sediminis]|uniref:hypothetical protein n=1 Tax=Nonomuraea sediminis TaxID=2835864 RepID=UPI001BDD581F|nr:hypothetical protein [Nonomuraea sediminis]
MTTRTEQETRRGAPVRGAAPKTGQRRPGVPHQSKPIPRPRPADDAARTAPETSATGLRQAPASEGARPAGGRVRSVRPAVRRVPSGRRQRAPFVLLIVGLLCGGLVSLLLLNTVLAQDSIKAGQLRDQIATARQQNEAAQHQIEIDTQPQKTAKQAELQGMHRDWDNVNQLRGASQDATKVSQGR